MFETATVVAPVTKFVPASVTVTLVPCTPVFGDTDASVGAGCSVILADPDFVVSAMLVAVTITVCALVTFAGAVYSPVALMLSPPEEPLIAHVTAVFVVLLTVAVNCCVAPAASVTAAGVTTTATGGISVTVAVAVFVVSDVVFAVMVTVCWVVIVDGAVYRPASLIVPPPLDGLTLHVTPVVQPFATAAVNCCVCPPYSIAALGEVLTFTAGKIGVVLSG